jgi:hypothetical protein
LSTEGDGEQWVAHYYQRLQNEYQFSLSRRDNITNWALTLFLAVVATYATIMTSQIVPSAFWRIAFLLVSLALLVRLFVQSMIAYSFLRRWRHLANMVESHWASGKPQLDGIVEAILKYDHGRRTTISKTAMLWSQLRAGFLLMFLVVLGVLSFELTYAQPVTFAVECLLGGFVIYLVWELGIFVTYDQLKRPSNRSEKTLKDETQLSR